MPQPEIAEPRTTCVHCSAQFVEDGAPRRRRGSRCTNHAERCGGCCDCLTCQHCTTYCIKRDWTIAQYAAYVSLPAESICRAVEVKWRLTGIDPTRQIRGIYSSHYGENVPWPCLRCLSRGWLSAVSASAVKLELTDYTEGTDDQTTANPKRRTVIAMNTMVFDRKEVKFHTGAQCDTYPSDIIAGNELECNSGGSLELSAVVNKWGGSIVGDGSVGNNGFEIVSGPASGKKYVEMIDEITEEARRCNSTINTDCGYHVHLDLRERTIDQIYKLMFLWCSFEPQFFAMMPPSRRQATRSSWWCKPLVPKLRVLQAVDKPNITRDEQVGFLVGGTVKPFTELMRRPFSGDRYRAINFTAYSRHKTVEIRLHSGTLMPTKIRPWTVLCVSLLEAAIKMSDDEIVTLLDNPNKSTRDKLLDIILTQEARDYVVSRQEQFKALNKPELLAQVFDPASDYRSYINQLGG